MEKSKGKDRDLMTYIIWDWNGIPVPADKIGAFISKVIN